MNVSWRKIRNNIQTHAQKYVVAVSGGVDSMFLLDFVSNCKTQYVIAHVDHKLRETSYLEKQLVEQTAKQLKVPFFHTECSGIADASSIEAEARNQRYAFLREVKQQVGAEKILTAHHLNDQVETILLRLMRGLPHDSLGMREDNGDVYRPFLTIPKDEIVAAAKRRNLSWIEDETNVSQDFERNWVRHTILPEMMKRRNVLKTIPRGANV